MVRIAIAQLDLTVGDLDGNVVRLKSAISRAGDEGAQVLVAPELAITGYPPEDLLLKSSFVQANLEAMREVASASTDAACVIGFVDSKDGHLYNAAAICESGRVAAIYHKHLLPNYGVFDEERYFEPGRRHVILDTEAGRIGVCVCEDAWFTDGPMVIQGDAGAQIVVNINASPFHEKKASERIAMLADRARRAAASVVYVNMVGGQDELVFDGGSIVLSQAGDVVFRAPQFKEHFEVVDVPLGRADENRHSPVDVVSLSLPSSPASSTEPTIAEDLGPDAETYSALVLGLRDYAQKNGFERIVVGLSGGIDSSLTAAIAADALGADRVLGVMMPSRFSSEHSVSDSKQLAGNLGIETAEIGIGSIYDAYLDALEGAFGKHEPSVAEENIQARIRGNLVMAISNRWGHLVLATGNKSEMACGYATLYGDMAGGFALLKDVFKTDVYALSHYRNTVSGVIPDNVLTKPPSAELRADQKDLDSLPAYDELDPILECYIEKDMGIEEIVGAGHTRAIVERVIALVDGAEYKRRQAPPGPKVTTKAFGRDRRLPISNRWRPRRDS